MHASSEQLARALVPFALAVAVGAAVRTAAGDHEVVRDGACRAFVGAASGNDPDVRVRVTLCREGQALRGQLVWHGRSGTSIRDLAGQVDGGRFVTLVDARIALDAPNPGWMFCPVDEYQLAWDARGGTLSGTYASAACADDAVLTLAVAR